MCFDIFVNDRKVIHFQKTNQPKWHLKKKEKRRKTSEQVEEENYIIYLSSIRWELDMKKVIQRTLILNNK